MARQWVLHKDPENRYGGYMTLGTRDVVVPENALISATRSENLTIGRVIINMILNRMIMKQLARMDGLLYAELTADMKLRQVQTMLVWSGKELAAFHRSGAHHFAAKFFRWVLLGGPVTFYSLNWEAKGRIPTAAEVTAVLHAHGKRYEGGKETRKPSRPVVA